MPYCDVNSTDTTKLFYRTYGHGPTKILLIIGLAGTHDSWGPQVKALTGTNIPNDTIDHPNHDNQLGSDGDIDVYEENMGVEVCTFDNRGMGRSSVPVKKSQYTTTIMAKDAIAIMDHLGWDRAHVFGHSMGAMIACKMAAMVPNRILSLALLNVTGGGYECFPKFDRKMISIAIRFLKAKTPEQRAAVDLDTHYTKEYLNEYVGTDTRRNILYQEYVRNISSAGMQSNYGFEGQANACWTHKMTSKELDVIRSAGFLISIIHGRYDVIAQISHARKLALKLQPSARMVDLFGGHLVSHERPHEVNEALLELLKASAKNLNPREWSNLPQNDTGSVDMQLSVNKDNSNRCGYFCLVLDMIAKLHSALLYLFRLFVMSFEYSQRVFSGLKANKVAISI